jgi:hypothetical protein
VTLERLALCRRQTSSSQYEAARKHLLKAIELVEAGKMFSGEKSTPSFMSDTTKQAVALDVRIAVSSELLDGGMQRVHRLASTL